MTAAVFTALANELRLTVFRLLIRRGPHGMSAGQIALRLEVPPSTLSAHLARLERAGLLRSRRETTHVIYAVDLEGTRRLVDFLINDCCEGHPEVCGYAVGPSPDRGHRPRRRSARELKRNG